MLLKNVYKFKNMLRKPKERKKKNVDQLELKTYPYSLYVARITDRLKETLEKTLPNGSLSLIRYDSYSHQTKINDSATCPKAFTKLHRYTEISAVAQHLLQVANH